MRKIAAKQHKTTLLPPDLVNFEKVIQENEGLDYLVTRSTQQAIKLIMINPVESLDIFFILCWLLERGINNIHVDWFTMDAILLRTTSQGVFRGQDVEDYCLPQNLDVNQPWLQKSSEKYYYVDPRYLLKIQFHWVESYHHLNKDEYDILVQGPMTKDRDSNAPILQINPCYKIELWKKDGMK